MYNKPTDGLSNGLNSPVNKKVERGVATRSEIVKTATQLFARDGYEAVSIEKVLAACAISRGALYHHFSSKEALFEAVFEAMEIYVAEQTVARSSGARGIIKRLRAGCEAFLDLAQEGAVRQIVLTDAPAVLGWERWREIDARHGFGLLKDALARIGAEGALPPETVEIFAHILLASLTEVALLMARSPDRKAAAARGKAAIQMLLTRLLGAS
jgi:AcrR family transcriptional regulator